VASAVVAERARELRELGAAQARRFRTAMVGRTEDALVLERVDPASGALTALTGNFVEVSFVGPDRLRRRVARVRVTDAGEHLAGGVLEESA
jgi:tRNA A37 methylthiotransferase MiaB